MSRSRPRRNRRHRSWQGISADTSQKAIRSDTVAKHVFVGESLERRDAPGSILATFYGIADVLIGQQGIGTASPALVTDGIETAKPARRFARGSEGFRDLFQDDGLRRHDGVRGRIAGNAALPNRQDGLPFSTKQFVAGGHGVQNASEWLSAFQVRAGGIDDDSNSHAPRFSASGGSNGAGTYTSFQFTTPSVFEHTGALGGGGQSGRAGRNHTTAESAGSIDDVPWTTWLPPEPSNKELVGKSETPVFLAQSTGQGVGSSTSTPQATAFGSSSCGFEEGLAGWSVSETGGSDAGRGTATVQDDAVVLREGDSLLLTLSRTFSIPAQPASLSFSYTNLTFDDSSPGAIKDAFEAAFLDAAGVPVASAYSEEREAFYNVTEGETPALGPDTSEDAGVVTVDLSQGLTGSQGTLVLRLVNNDSDHGSNVRIQCVATSDEAPEAGFSWAPASPVEGASVQFTDESTSSPDAIVGWHWDFGGLGTSTAQHPSFTFLDNGNYPVTLTVTDEDGSTNSLTRQVTISDQVPLAAFSWMPSSPTEGAPVQFTDESTSSPDTIVSWLWDFGGLGTSALQHPSFTFLDNGNYPVTLTVTDEDGSTNSLTRQVAITDQAPLAAFSWMPSSPAEGAPVQFTDESTSSPDAIVGWLWDFDRLGTSTAQHPSFNFLDNGNYFVTLTVTDEDGSINSLTRQVTITDQAPLAAFSWTPVTSMEGASVQFTDESTSGPDAIVSWLWDFDGLGTSTAQHPSFTFLDHGNHSVTLTVTDEDGSTNSLTRQVTITDQTPLAAFSWGPGSPIEGAPVQFTDESTSSPDEIAGWLWDFDGLGTSTAQHPSFTFLDHGSYSVTLTVTDEDGSTNSLTRQVFVADQAPLAAFSWTPSSPTEGSPVQFTDESTSSPDTIVSWLWDFDGLGTSAAQHPSFTFLDNGNHPVTLTVTDEDGSTNSLTRQVTISDQAPLAAFSWSPSSPTEGSPVQFTDESISSPDTITSWLWDFGGLGTSTAQHPSFTFLDNGSYPVTLTVADEDGSTNSLVRTVSVGEFAPIADFTWTPTSPAEGSSVQFTDESTSSPDTIVSWLWDFGGLGTSTAQHPSFTFLDDGNHSVTLTVTDEDGSTNSLTRQVTITDLGPTAAFSWTPASPIEGAPVQFIDESTSGPDAIVSWLWDFDGLGTSTAQHPSFTFLDHGNHPVTLTVTDDDGSTNSLTLQVTITDQAPQADFSWTLISQEEGAPVQFTDESTSSPDAIVSWLWDFDGLGTSTAQHPNFTFLDDGNHSVTLTVTDEDGSTNSLTRQVTITDLGPTAAFSWTPASPIEGTPVQFIDESTSYPDEIVSRKWSFDGFETSVLQNPTITFPDNGNYLVTLTVTDEDGSTSSAMHLVTIADQAPLAGFSWTPSTPTEGAPVQFTDESASSPDTIVSWLWDFGGLGTSTSQNPSFTFLDNGSHPVTLTVTDEDGSTNSQTRQVTITDQAPLAAFSWTPVSPIEGAPVQFADESTSSPDAIVSWLWDFGGLGTSSLRHPSFTFLDDGSYSVTLTVTDEDGSANSLTRQVTIAATTPATKFFVVDTQADRVFHYGREGESGSTADLAQTNNSPRGITTTATADVLWVVDVNKRVWVYGADGSTIGQWRAVDLSRPEGIATDGADVWIMDGAHRRIDRLAHAAQLRAGDVHSTSSFDLHRDNRTPTDIATDGSRLWVTDDSDNQVYVYGLTGQFLGRWQLDSANADPAGITNEPGSGNDIWVVDRNDRRVYKYTGGEAWLSGSHASTGSFPLDSRNGAPEGIADPPTPGVTVQESDGSTAVSEGGLGDSYTVVLDTQPASDVAITVTPASQLAVNDSQLVFYPNSDPLNALRFDGIDDYVSTGLPVNQGSADSTSYTFEAWVKPADASGTQGYHIVSTNAGSNDWSLLYTNGMWGVMTGTSFKTSGLAVDVGQWQHVAAVFDRALGVTKFYKNGQEVVINELSFSTTDANVTIGKNPATTAVFEGEIDEVRVWTTARSHAQIDDSMFHTLNGTEANLRAYWKFDEGGSATTSADSATLGGADNATLGAGVVAQKPSWIASNAPLHNWDFPQTVQVTAVNDATPEGDHAAAISHSAASSDPAYAGAQIGNVRVSIEDNDQIGVAVNVNGTELHVAEDVSKDTYLVSLTSEPTSDVVVNVVGDGQVSASPAQLTFHPGSSPGYALNFDGVDDYVSTTLAINQASGSAGATFEAWVRPTDASGTQGYHVISTNSGGSDWSLAAANGKWGVLTGNGFRTSGLRVDVGIWQHVAAVFNPSANQIIVYKNDESVTISEISFSTTAAPVHMGKNPATTAVFAGQIDEARVWSVPLSSGDIISRSYQTLTGAEPGLLGYWKFDDGAGSRATDSVVGTAHHGLLGAGVLAAHPQWARSSVPLHNWNTPQAVTVSATDDTLVEGEHATRMVHSVTSGDTSYHGLTVPAVDVRIADNDAIGIRMDRQPGPIQLSEGGPGAEYQLSLTSPPTSDVVVTVNTGDQLSASSTHLHFRPGTGPGNALRFDGKQIDSVGDYVATNLLVDQASATSTGATFEAWVLPTGTDTTKNYFVVGTDNGGFDWSLLYNSGTWRVWNGVESRPTGVPVDVGVWQHVAGVFDKANNRVLFYKNGKPAAVIPAIGFDASSNAVAIGRNPGSEGFFEGTIDEVRVWNRPLQPTEIANNHRRELLGGETGLAGYWRFDEGHGSWAGDTTSGLYEARLGDLTLAAHPKWIESSAPLEAWFVPQSVSFEAADDRVAESDHTAMLTHTVSSTDPNYNALPSDPISASIVDNDQAGVIVTPTGSSTDVVEGAEPDQYLIKLGSQPLAEVQVNLATDSQVSASPAQLSFGPNVSTGHALSFDGADDTVATRLNINQSASSPGVTFEAWVYPTGNVAGRWYMVVGTTDGGADWSLFYTDGFWHVNTGDGAQSTGIAVDLNAWQHVAVSFLPLAEDNFIRFMKNDEEVRIHEISTDVSDADVTLGSAPGSGSHFQGVIDDVRIWRGEVSPTDILARMDQPLTGHYPSLLGYWPFDEGAGLVTADQSGGNWTATLGGGQAARRPQWVTSDRAELQQWETAQVVDLRGTPDGVLEGFHESVIAITASSGDPLYQAANLVEMPVTLRDDPLTSGQWVFTNTDEFNSGELFNLSAAEFPDELRLNRTLQTYPYVWVPNSDEGTISKFDSRTGKELARYFTGPSQLAANGGLSPSRMAVTSEGDVWVANRAFGIQGTVVKILNDSYIDRNGNGRIDTSFDADGDGRISPDEMLKWDRDGDGEIDDERIEFAINAGRNFNSRNTLVQDGIPRAVAIDQFDRVWVGLYNLGHYEVYDNNTGELIDIVRSGNKPYGAVIDSRGILWTVYTNYNDPDSGIITAIDTNAIGTTTNARRSDLDINTLIRPYGLAVDRDDVIWISSYDQPLLYRYEVKLDEELDLQAPIEPALSYSYADMVSGQPNARGVTVDNERNVWVAVSAYDKVVKMVFEDDHRTLRGKAEVAVNPDVNHLDSPTGMAIDADGFVWTTLRDPDNFTVGDYVYKIDPTTNTVVPGWPKRTGEGPYSYSDLTGQWRLTVTEPTGSWTRTVDSQQSDAMWGTVWADYDAPTGTEVAFRIRASNDESQLSAVAWRDVTSGEILQGVTGRFLQLRAVLSTTNRNVTPIVRELIAALAPSAPVVSISTPTAGTALPKDSEVVIGGLAQVGAIQVNAELSLRNYITALTINGRSVDALDSYGGFFASEQLGVDQNTYVVEATDAYGRRGSATITVQGLDSGDASIDLAALSDVSASFQPRYGRTSWQGLDGMLHAELAIENLGTYAADVPLIVAIANLSDPSIAVVRPDGITPDGLPYFDFSHLVDGRSLDVSASTLRRNLTFYDPEGIPFTYQVLVRGRLNAVPVVSSTPGLDVTAGDMYAYQIDTTDPDQDPLSFALVSGPASATLDSSTGLLQWNTSPNDIGNHVVTISASDGRGGQVEQRFLLSVLEPSLNRRPLFTSVPQVVAYVGETYVYDANAVDPDGDLVHFELRSRPAGMPDPDGSTGAISWSVLSGDVGEHGVTIAAIDSHGAETLQEYVITVRPPRENHEPFFTTVPPQRVASGRSYSYDARAVDPDGDAIEFFFQQSPAGMTLTADGRVFWASPVNGAQVTLGAMDTLGSVSTQSFTLSVISAGANASPTIAPIPPTTLAAGSPYEFVLQANDADGDLLEFSIQPNAPFATVPDGLRIDVATQTVRWDAVVTDGFAGTISVSDGRGGSASALLQLSTSTAVENTPPELPAIIPQAAVVGEFFSYPAAGRLQARDLNGDPVRFDLPVAPDGMSIDAETGVIAWTPRLTQTGLHDVVVRAADPANGVALQSFTIDVAATNTPPVFVTIPQERFGTDRSYKYLAHAQDADGDALHYSLVTAPAGMHIDAETGLVSWQSSGSHGLTFSGGDDAVFLPTGVLAGQATVTFEAWIKTTKQTAQSLISGVSSTNDEAFSILLNSSTKLTYGTGTSAFPYDKTISWEFGTHPLADGNWHHVAIVRNPAADSSVRLFLDGSLIEIQNFVATFPIELRPGALVLGRDLDATGNLVTARAFEGEMDEVRVWTTARTGDQLRASMFEELAGNESGLRAYWRFDEGSGAIANDGSLHGFQLGDPAAGDARDSVIPWGFSDLELERQHQVEILVQDGRGGVATQSFTIDLHPLLPNDPPRLESSDENPPPRKLRLGDAYAHQVAAFDPDGDAISYSLAFADPLLFATSEPIQVDLATGVVRWQAPDDPAWLGAHDYTIRIEDGLASPRFFTWTIEVTTESDNSAPRITTTPRTTATVGRQYSYDLSANDEHHDAMFWKLASGPAGMSLDPQFGTLRWTPTDEQEGQQEVVLEAFDVLGGVDTQSFTIDVRSFNVPPNIQSSPPTRAVVDQSYLYGVNAVDPNGDLLTYTLMQGPEGMVIGHENGFVHWTPRPSQMGVHEITIEVTDGQEGTVVQSFSVEVRGGQPNRAPVITSSPMRTTVINGHYEHQFTASDSEQNAFTFAFGSFHDSRLSGMSLTEDGLLSWDPVDVPAGVYKVSVIVVDEYGDGTTLSYPLTVRELNRAPVIEPVFRTRVSAGAKYRFDVSASDPDGDALTYGFVDGASVHPAAMTIDSLGRIEWDTTTADLGAHPIQIFVEDSFGARTIESFTLEVEPDTRQPLILLATSASEVNIGESFDVQVLAADDVKVVSVALTIDGTPYNLDANGRLTYNATAAGVRDIVATAVDSSGNSRQATARVSVLDPSVTGKPTVSISSPGSGTLVTKATSIFGTAAGANFLSYRILVAPFGSPTALREVYFSETPVLGGALGQFDPTLLSNDAYRVVVEARNTGGATSRAEIRLDVAGELKLGNFTLSFTDLSVPVNGIPLTVTRTYDTLLSNEKSELGYGWRMEFRDTNLRTTVKPTGDEVYGIYNRLRIGDRVFLTPPGGKRVSFRFDAEREFGFGGDEWYPRFTPDNGEQGQLVVPRTRLQPTPSGFEVWGIHDQPYNPADPVLGGGYTYISPEGIEYFINAASGDLLTVEDTNDNRIDYTTSSIVANAGTTGEKRVTLRRDARGRITALIDPRGNEIIYKYEKSSGDLVSVTDRAGNETTLQYRIEIPHYLESVTDPRGITGVRSDFDDAGRLISVTDAKGTPITFEHNLGDNEEVIRDQFGVPTIYVYDGRGNVLREINALGHVIEREYNNKNDVTKQRESFPGDSLVRVTEYVYNSLGDVRDEVVSELDPVDPQNPNDDIVTPLQVTQYRDYNKYHNPKNVFQPGGLSTSNKFDARGNLLSTTSPDGQVTEFGYFSSGNAKYIKDVSRNLLVSQFEYFADGQIKKQTDAEGNVTTYQYQDVQPSQTTLNLGGVGHRTIETRKYTPSPGAPQVNIVTTTLYDSSDRVREVVDAEGNVTRSEYDANGQRNKSIVIDATGAERITRYEYDERGLLTKTIFPDETPGDLEDNPYARTIYDDAGREAATYDELGHETRFEYDVLGRPTKTFYADVTADPDDNPFTETVYVDRVQSIVQQFDERRNMTQTEHDGLGRVVKTIFADATPDDLSDNPSTRTIYDAAGRVSKSIDQLEHETRFEYDTAGRPTKTFLPDHAPGNTADDLYTQTLYDAEGRVVGRRDEAGKVTNYGYDDLGRLTSVELPAVDDPNDGLPGLVRPRTEYAYDEVGNLVLQRDAEGRETRYEYDRLGRRVVTVLPLGQRSTTEYDSVGNFISTTDFNGQTITFAYDERDRLRAKFFENGDADIFTYTPTGQRDIVTQYRGTSERTTDYDYDERERLVRRTDPDGTEISYSYDAAGNRTSVTTPSGTVSYTFDVQNRMETVTDPDLGVTRYQYDQVSRLMRTEFPNGTYEIRDYDEHNRLESVTTRDGSDVVIDRHQYVFSREGVDYGLAANGNREAVLELDGRFVDYEYDALDRLVGEDIYAPGSSTPTRTIDYVYDLVGNRLSRDDSAEGQTEYLYDDNDRLLTEALAGDITRYDYDANGNALRKSNDTTGHLLTEYFWDQENRLVAADTDGDGAVDVTNAYNVDGIRIAQTVGGDETRFLIDANLPYAQVLEEYTPGGIIKVSYVHGHDLISQNRSSDGVHFAKSIYHVDGLGSTRALTNSSGLVTDRYLYDAFGRTIGQVGSTANAYLFAGEQRDFEIGLDYLRARFLTVNTGRFVNRDPLSSRMMAPITIHRYLYGNANPTKFTDPSGLMSLGEVNVSGAIQSILRTISTGYRFARTIYTVKGLEDYVLLSRVAFLTSYALLSTDPKVGFEVKVNSLSKLGQIDKFSVRFFTIPDSVVQFAIDLRNGDRVRTDINLSHPERSATQFGRNVPLHTPITIGSFEVLKLEAAVRWAILFSEGLSLGHVRVNLEGTVAQQFKVQFRIYEFPRSDGTSSGLT